MAFRIKTITKSKGFRCYITIEEIDVESKPTGREFTEPFGLKQKNWDGLKKRFENAVKRDNEGKVEIQTLRDEAENAKLTQLNIV